MKLELHKKVRIKETGELAYIVWFDEDENNDSVLLEIIGENKMPEFYVRKDFDLVEN